LDAARRAEVVHKDGSLAGGNTIINNYASGSIFLYVPNVDAAFQRVDHGHYGRFQKVNVIDALIGEVKKAQLFVAVLGASSLTFAEATWTQTLPDWIGSHTRAFAFFGGVAAMTVSDNLKSGVIKACFYEPAVNRSYAEMAAHYDTAIVPARPYKPRDKAKVEVGVQVVTRWIIAKLRKRQFFSLSELNALQIAPERTTPTSSGIAI
jgi:transposase